MLIEAKKSKKEEKERKKENETRSDEVRGEGGGRERERKEREEEFVNDRRREKGEGERRDADDQIINVNDTRENFSATIQFFFGVLSCDGRVERREEMDTRSLSLSLAHRSASILRRKSFVRSFQMWRSECAGFRRQCVFGDR